MGPQTKGTIWNAIFTFILVVVTGVSVCFSWKMTKVVIAQLELTREQYRLSYRPYIYFDEFELEPEKFKGLQYRAVVKNSGLVPAKIKLEKYCENTEDNCVEDEKFFYAFPDSDGHNIGSINPIAEIQKHLKTNIEFKLIFKFKYWAINDVEMKKPYMYEATVGIFKDPNNPSNFLHENIYVNAD